MKIKILLLFFYSTACFALPNKPSNPDSVEAFNQIISYYGIENSIPDYSVKQITDQVKDGFIYREVTLIIHSSLLKDRNEIHFILKIPLYSTKLIFPAISLFTGFQTGEEAINLIENQGENILVGFQYPMPITQENHALSWDWSAFESIPLLMTVTVHWLQQQSYNDTQRISL
jgi:hypothetical protein